MGIARIVALVLMCFIANSLLAQREIMADTARVAKDSTLTEYLEAYKVRPDDARLNLKIARIYLREDSFALGLPYALKTYELMPQNDDASYVAGALYYKLKQYALSVEFFRKAIAIDPDHGYFSYCNLARIMLNTDTTLVTSKRDFIDMHSYNVAEMVKWAKDPNHKYYHNALKDKFAKDWSSLSLDEFYMLYFGRSVQPDYDPYANHAAISEELRALYNDEKYDEGVKVGNMLLQEHSLDLNVNWYLAMCYYKLENYALYEKYMSIYRSFLLGIVSTGDGDEPESAYIVISVDDEAEVMYYLSYKQDKQELVNINGHTFDKITGIDTDTKEDLVVYFNIDRPFRALTGMLDGIDVPEDKKGKKKK